MPKLFGPIRERYLERPGGYTRVLRIEPVKEDQAESAILELVDGPKDLRFAMTAKTLSRLPAKMRMNELTARNVKKVTQFREDGIEGLRTMVERMKLERRQAWDDRKLARKKPVYLLDDKHRREMHIPDDVPDWELPNKFKTEDGAEVPAGTHIRSIRELLEKKEVEKDEQTRAQTEARAKAHHTLTEVQQST